MRTRVSRGVFIGVLAALLCAAIAAPGLLAQRAITYQLNQTDAHVSFTVTKWMVFKEEGRFRDVRGTILFDKQKPEDARIEVTVQTASLDTNNRTRDEVVRSDDFLDVVRHPTMTFVSTAVRPAGNDKYTVTGDLTIRGVTRQVTVTATLLGLHEEPGLGDLIGFETTFHVNRTDYGVLGTRWSGGKAILGHDVQVHMRLGGMNRRR